MGGKYLKKSPKKRVGTIVFFLLYFSGIAAFFVGLHQAVIFLNSWLTDYEAAQPKVKCEQVFHALFDQPDWEKLYEMAGCENTAYETAAHYGVYMRARQAGQPLQYHETSAGLSDDKKYVVTLGQEKVATFTLTSSQQDANAIPDWELGAVEVFFTRRQAVTIQTDPDCTVYVNGVALSQEHVIKTLHTTAESYLPEGVHGLRWHWLYLDGLLVSPEVTAQDPQGNAVALSYDENSHTYVQQPETMDMTQEQADTVVKAAKTYCRYMIRQESRYNMSKLFVQDSEIYQTISGRGPWTHDYKSYRFTEPELRDYYRYSDTLYSVMLKMSLFVTSTWNSVKEFPLESTFFLEQQEDGRWLVSNMTNVDVQKQTTMVRMTYIANGETVCEEMVDAAAIQLVAPSVTAPEGKTFTGWYRMQTDEAGRITYSLAFKPDAQGIVTFSGEQALESMTLYALFE